ncbi:RyPTPR4a [Oopsacas minuta]|uniref:RyPTPR4a n=1 Tax=Oopsacas minuta TaxID=111878 RepID=A0AAV7KB87_9METZ|nr:RyPTPR4a [Oopsacas minuta]
MGTNFYQVVLLFTISASLYGILAAQTPNISLTYDDTTFGYFIASPINWTNAELECNNWGGNLATIKSTIEESLLFYSAPEPDISYVSCYIGLNDIDVEAGTDASAFVWVDGSNSTYRNFQSNPGIPSPSEIANHDCVRTRYNNFAGELSTGWINRACTITRSCYFCNKAGNSQGCDLIYEGSCYRLFEISDGINWLDAQSSCAVWGGDLTSITTERENNYLYTIIPDTVSNCWIGLNDRDGDGTYVWIDGSVYSHTNWTGSEPTVIDEDCVDIIRAGEGSWEIVDCETTTINAFLCKRPSSVTTAGGFGQLANGRLEFVTISENTFLFSPHTLAYGGEKNIAITWLFSENSDLSSSQPETATYENMVAGWSWLTVDITKQGYYQCQVNSETYTIGLYDNSSTTVATEGTPFVYIVGVDREDVLLLCDPVVSGDLSMLKWSLTGSGDFLNPINIYNERNNLPEQSTGLNCVRDSSIIFSNFISVQVPELTIEIGSISLSKFTAVCPAMNVFDIPLSTQDITLSTNIVGKWTVLGVAEPTGSTTTIEDFMEGNAGLYQFQINNWDGVDVCAIQITLSSSPAITAMNPEEEFISEDNAFGYFTISTGINWITAQLYCINWGGNLATIKSTIEDSLLFYSITDLDNAFSCLIGLNDIDVEAGTDASAFVWVDGSNSTYRNFQSNFGIASPSEAADNDCVRFRYQSNGGVLSTGWINRRCALTRSCYFCNKAGNSQGCDLIYEGSCYRLFEISDGINWLDAQSSCAVWGGDLTSITTERENNYLYTIIPDTVSNCWIGLNDRSVEGTYTWTDGSVYSHTNWTGSELSISNEDCVDIIRAGEGSWGTVDCETTTINAFLCKRPSSVTTVGGFGKLTNGGLDFETISENTFLFISNTLAYGGEENIAITWIFSENSDLSDSEVLTATYSSTEAGWSWLTVDITKQGYYQCQVNSETYTIGLYDNSLTTVASDGTPFVYIVGVDREDVLLLCDPVISGDLSMLKWSLTGSGDFLNPINIYNERNNLPEQSTGLNCMRDSNIIFSNFISIQVPEISIQIGSISASKFTALCPAVNEIAIPLSTQDITLSTNIVGKWTVLGVTNPTGSTTTIDNFMEGNTGLYKFYINNWDGVDVCAIQVNLSSSPAITEMNPEEEFILDGNTFRYFTISSGINWITAQLYCINWGGNLATIKSAEEDSLLFYSITDLDTFSCYIGLNDIDVEAGTDTSEFVWVDGSNSTYRNFQSDYGISSPSDSNPEYDCVRFRYQVGCVLSTGWINRGCQLTRLCYFCNKQGNSQGCDLIYDDFCYRLFEVSDGINWLDAQSSCAVWGGDLTSITTERENNYLYTIIPDTVSNCWIGLNDRDGDGSYTWTDGSVYSHTNWTGMVPSISNEDCVDIIRAGEGSWGTVSCGITRNTFLCKRSSIITTGASFGELINEGLDFQSMSGNRFLYQSLTLACGGDEDNAIVWKFSENSDLSNIEELTTTNNSTQTGISWLDIYNTRQGYYQCQIDDINSYTIGLFNQTTTIAVTETTYTYTVGIDRENVLLLCDPMNSSYSLSSLIWSIEDGSILNNPINIFEWSSDSPEQSNQLTCDSNDNIILLNTVNIYTPIITVSTSTSDQAFNTVYPDTNMFELLIGIEDFSISTNLQGRWKLPDITYSSSQTISYATLDYEFFGLYQFYIMNWDGIEVIAIQAELIRNGYFVTNPISTSSTDSISNDSTILLKDSTVLQCSISNIGDSVAWYFMATKDGMKIDKTSLSTFSIETGISSLIVNSNEPGYYSCEIGSDMAYAFFIVNTDSLVEITSFDGPFQEVDYTRDSIVSMLYYSDDMVADNEILWTTDNVEDGDILTYSAEYPNPALLIVVFNDVGAGLHTFSCFYRMSPVALLGTIQLALKDTATITVSYEGYNMSFSDVNNLMFPSPQVISILQGTKDITLTCSLPECEWMISNQEDTMIKSTYIIPQLTFSENISLIRSTSYGVKYTTAHISIQLVTTPTNPTEAVTNIPLITIVIINVLLIMAIIVATIILTPIFILLCVKIRRQSNKAKLSEHSNPTYSNIGGRGGYPSYENQPEANQQTKEYIDLSTYPNREYVITNETSLTTLDETINPNERGFAYFSNIPHEIVNETEQSGNSEMKNYEKYTPMSPIIENKKFTAKFIPMKDFPIKYQQYVESGIGEDSSLSVEFQKLNEESKKTVVLESDNALKEESLQKNPFKNILPFDENRVVLDSPHFDCNYINASYINDYQFIATINPTKETHLDFLQMIYQTEASMVIMLTTREEKAKILSGISNRVCYWPKKDEPINCEPFVSTLINSTETNAFVKQEISLKNTLVGKEHSFTQCISPIWNEDGTVLEMALADILLIRIMKQKQDSNNVPIIIHCEDGISKTGIIITVLNSIRELNIRKSINIFNAVKNSRRQRMNMVPTLACYTTCYSLLNEYCSIHL